MTSVTPEREMHDISSSGVRLILLGYKVKIADNIHIHSSKNNNCVTPQIYASGLIYKMPSATPPSYIN